MCVSSEAYGVRNIVPPLQQRIVGGISLARNDLGGGSAHRHGTAAATVEGVQAPLRCGWRNPTLGDDRSRVNRRTPFDLVLETKFFIDYAVRGPDWTAQFSLNFMTYSFKAIVENTLLSRLWEQCSVIFFFALFQINFFTVCFRRKYYKP